jgi:hypothetical protein
MNDDETVEERVLNDIEAFHLKEELELCLLPSNPFPLLLQYSIL